MRDKLTLIGISMGGMISIDWMLSYPEEIKSAILINTNLPSFSPFFQRLRWQKYPLIIGMIFCSATRNERQLLSLTSNLHTHNDSLLKSWIEWRKKNSVSTCSAINQMLAILKFSVKSKPLQPVLIMTSKSDQMVSFQCSVKLHYAWQSEYQQHELAGHDIPLDDPEWVTQVIQQWINKV